MRLHIIFADAPARPGAFHLVNVHADLARQSADVTALRALVRAVRCPPPFPVAPAWRKLGRDWLRLIGWKRLLFGFALGLDRGLESQARSVLSGDVLDRSVLAAVPVARAAALQR